MDPSPTDLLWSHIPNYGWPLIIIGVLGFFLVQIIKASETIAEVFGWPGKKIHDKATIGRRTLQHVKHIEDNLDCALTYLVEDQAWHEDADIVFAHSFPRVSALLPARITFAEYRKRWQDGWRPVEYQEDH